MRRGQQRRAPHATAVVLICILLVADYSHGFLQGQGRASAPRRVACKASRDAAAASYGFDALSLSSTERLHVLSALAERLEVAEALKVPASGLQAYLEDCLQAMPPSNPYHGPSHVVDILQFLVTLLEETGLDRVLTPEFRAVLFLAGAAHDVDHTGTTNAFLVSLGHTYVEEAEDGVGPMESHSAQRAAALLEERLHLPRSKLRDAVKATIHGTDLARHQQIVDAFQDEMEAALTEEAVDAFFSPQSAQGQLLLQLLLKAGDVSNPTRPLATAKAWNQQVYQEFYAEGDQVLSAGGKPNPLHDRRTNSIPKSSVGFINWVKSIFTMLKEFLVRCRKVGVSGLRPEGLDAVLARLDENAASFAKEAAMLEAADASNKVSEIHSGR
ncbi:PDE7A [Symbiodinium natans]|uniref:PDE7A protein n=1 Tax=Symbiodinium natans TaxID=878477 RepID=A0A812V6S4_9DINO|nr:PDE7A [Symbiodinium natans]